MREHRPSLAYRLSWLFPPVAIVTFAWVTQGSRIFDLSDPLYLLGGLANLAYFLTYAAVLARDALRRRQP